MFKQSPWQKWVQPHNSHLFSTGRTETAISAPRASPKSAAATCCRRRQRYRANFYEFNFAAHGQCQTWIPPTSPPPHYSRVKACETHNLLECDLNVVWILEVLAIWYYQSLPTLVSRTPHGRYNLVKKMLSCRCPLKMQFRWVHCKLNLK